MFLCQVFATKHRPARVARCLLPPSSTAFVRVVNCVCFVVSAFASPSFSSSSSSPRESSNDRLSDRLCCLRLCVLRLQFLDIVVVVVVCRVAVQCNTLTHQPLPPPPNTDYIIHAVCVSVCLRVCFVQISEQINPTTQRRAEIMKLFLLCLCSLSAIVAGTYACSAVDSNRRACILNILCELRVRAR